MESQAARAGGARSGTGLTRARGQRVRCVIVRQLRVPAVLQLQLQLLQLLLLQLLLLHAATARMNRERGEDAAAVLTVAAAVVAAQAQAADVVLLDDPARFR